MAGDDGEVAVTDEASIADDATESDGSSAVELEKTATEEEASASESSYEPARFRGQYGFVPATN